jgi:hypothetical protein
MAPRKSASRPNNNFPFKLTASLQSMDTHSALDTGLAAGTGHDKEYWKQ